MSLESLNERYRAFITLKEVRGKPEGRLKGLRFAVKDVIFVKGVRTTAGSKILADFVPERNATVVERILDEGGIIVGKANTHEFAIGATGTSSAYGIPKNPVDNERITGGSSSGSALAVALGMADVGIGTDTGGSVRIPASLCGVIGFKPTLGLIPTDGVIPFSWSLDTIGILARDLSLVRLTFEVISNKRLENRTTSVSKRLVLGVFRLGDDEGSKGVRKVVDKISSHFDVTEVKLPVLDERGNWARRVIASVEGAAFHKPLYEANKHLYFPDVRRAIEFGMSLSGVDYVNAFRVRKDAIREFVKVMKSVNFLLTPTTKIVAPRISDVVGREQEYRETLISNTELFNLLGAPSVSLPLGSYNGLPVGLMVTGALYDDLRLLSVSEEIIRIVGR
ncbi:MAG: amidase [Sulfolobales archaeon]|nr:amidase [Sulfolobales archaeon]